MTLQQVAAQAQVDLAHLSRVERGERQFSVEALHRVALVVHLDDLARSLEPFLPRERTA